MLHYTQVHYLWEVRNVRAPLGIGQRFAAWAGAVWSAASIAALVVFLRRGEGEKQNQTIQSGDARRTPNGRSQRTFPPGAGGCPRGQGNELSEGQEVQSVPGKKLAVTELGAAVGGEHAAKMTTDWEGP